MNKSELIASVAVKADVSKAVASNVVDALIATVTEAAVANDTVVLPGLCKVTVRDTPERQVRNPSTGETMTKAAGRAVKITVAKGLKDAVKV